MLGSGVLGFGVEVLRVGVSDLKLQVHDEQGNQAIK